MVGEMSDPSEKNSTRKPIGKMIGWIAIAITLVFIASIALRIDDWSRNWSENTATLSDDAERPGLRPVRLDLSPEQAEEKIRSWVESTSNWQYVGTTSQNDGSIDVKLIRQTSVMRFTDDIEVQIRADVANAASENASGERVVITATSQSRVGKGDLGQNPRNLIELTKALRE